MNDLYRKGYIAGYRDGVRDALERSIRAREDSEMMNLPLKAIKVSSRGINCLCSAGCRTVGDVVALDGDTIRVMRNMGKKTAHEIACWLCENGVISSAWSDYL